MKNKRIIMIFFIHQFNKINKIGKRTFVSDFLLPGNKDIIFLSLEIKLSKVVIIFFFQLKDDQQKYF